MMLKKKCLLVVLIAFFGLSISAQNEKETEKIKKETATIYLKNGSIIYGVLEQNDDIVVIKTRDGNVFAYQSTDLEKIDFDGKPILGNGAYHQFGFNVSHSATEFNGSFKIVNGYQVASKMYFGLGVGIERYYYRTYVPLMLEVQYHPFSNWHSQPYISTSLSKLMLGSDENNGWLGGVQVGFAHPLGNKVDILTTIGYRHGVIEREDYYYDWWSSYQTENYRKYEINRLEFGIGFMIK